MRSRWWRLETWLALAALALLLSLPGCAQPSPLPPSPPPTTQPSPSPEPPPLIAFPLSARNGKFVDLNNKPVWLTGPAWCCRDSKHYDWPLTSREGMERARDHGATWAMIRNGPTVRLEGQQFDFYVRPGHLWDLTRFSEPYLTWLTEISDDAERLGLALEVDLIDGWNLRQRTSPPLNPWVRENNINGIDAGDCSILAKAPQAVHRAFVREIVRAVGHSLNVMWHEGNEVSICGGVQLSLAFIEGIEREVRLVEAENGFVHHLFGTNASESEIRRSPVVEYVTLHQPVHAGSATNGKPTLVNEYRNLRPEEWEREARLAKSANTGWAYWRGDNSQAELADTLHRMKLITSGN